MRLAGKSALITGAAGGNGRAFAAAYIAEGARVAIADINIDDARRTAAELGEAAIAVELDVSDKASIDRAVAETVARFGRIDILINSAALFTAAPIVEITPADYARVFDVNVAGTLFTLQAVARHMIGAGIKGKIINMASQAERHGDPQVAVCCASKAAVISLTQSAGLHLATQGINVNAISPDVAGGDPRDGIEALFAKYEGKPSAQGKKDAVHKAPCGRMDLPQGLTGMAIFLASTESDYIVAQTYNVDGGQWVS